jgi:hypothetical protein
MKPLDFISVSELSKLIKNKEVSPTELLDSTLKKIEKLDPILNSFAFLDIEGAKILAKNSEKRMLNNNFYAINYLPLNDAKCDFLMDSANDILKNFYSLKNALKEENRKNVFFIEYSSLVKNPKDTFKNLYSFLEQDYFEHDFDNVNKKELDLGYQAIDPKGMHDIRKKVLDTSLNPKDVLSKYVIDKYSGYDFWKGQI